MNMLNWMEGSGFNLSPKARAMIMSAATSEDSGALSQLLNQEAMVHGMTPQEQTYTAALMPVLQAAGHDQSGADSRRARSGRMWRACFRWTWATKRRWHRSIRTGRDSITAC